MTTGAEVTIMGLAAEEESGILLGGAERGESENRGAMSGHAWPSDQQIASLSTALVG